MNHFSSVIIINGRLGPNCRSLLEERKGLIVKVSQLQNDLIMTSNTLDQYREKLGGTAAADDYVEYDDSTNLYDEAGDYDNNAQATTMIRYNSDPELRESKVWLWNCKDSLSGWVFFQSEVHIWTL